MSARMSHCLSVPGFCQIVSQIFFSSLYLGANFNIINSKTLCRVFSSTIHLINIEHLWYPFRKGGLGWAIKRIWYLVERILNFSTSGFYL